MPLTLTGPAGLLEAIIDTPPAGQPTRAVVVFCHPHPQHGGTMHTKAVFQGAKGLARSGCTVVRFNFRGVGASGGTFGSGDGERADFRAVVDHVAREYPGLPIWAAGFSFGSWVALEEGSIDPRISVLIAIAPPVARDGYVFDHVRRTAKPKFFVQGSLDELCPLKALRAFYAGLEEPKELVVIDGADHLFDGRTPEVGEALEDLVGDFVA
jgi:alpha/beta superfamily hydrolase